MRLTAAERDQIPDALFALPDIRKFPIHDYDHAKAASARISEAWHNGWITPEQHAEALANVRVAERFFGITPGAGSFGFNALDSGEGVEGLSNMTKLGILGGLLAVTAAYAWWARPGKGDYQAGKAASGPGSKLKALAKSLTPAQKAAVHAARAAGKSPVQALLAAGVTPAELQQAAGI